jgi:hypothetical protein
MNSCKNNNKCSDKVALEQMVNAPTTIHRAQSEINMLQKMIYKQSWLDYMLLLMLLK